MMVTILICSFFCMLVTLQSVTSIIICQNVMLVIDMLCWRHEIQPGVKFKKKVPTDPEALVSVTNIIIRQNVMLVTDI